MTALADRVIGLADRLRSMQPIRHDPHFVHVEKCDIERELRDLGMTLRDIERGVNVVRETISVRKDADG